MPSRPDGKPMASLNGKAANCGCEPAPALLVGTGRRNRIQIALATVRCKQRAASAVSWNGQRSGAGLKVSYGYAQ
jgi:hypothetical protein